MLHWNTKLVTIAVVALALAAVLDAVGAFGFFWT